MNQGFPANYWPHLYWPLLPAAVHVGPPHAGAFGVQRLRPAGAGCCGSK
jgi:hypothetical protein